MPATAVFLKGDRHYAFVEVSKGVFERRAVQVAVEHDGTALITEGLQEGEKVVARGGLLLNSILIENGDGTPAVASRT